MRFFDRYTSFWLMLCCLPLLFLPKINLMSLGDRETAGIRIDDIVLLVFCVVLFWSHFSLRKKMCPEERWMMALVLFSLFSFLSNRMLVATGYLHVNASLFYCLRLFEYFLFFYIGALAALFFRVSTVIKVFFLWNVLLMALQKFGLIGQISVSGYVADASDRVSGIASFPSEAGVLLDMVFCFLVFNDEKGQRRFVHLPANMRAFLNQTYVYWMFLLCATL